MQIALIQEGSSFSVAPLIHQIVHSKYAVYCVLSYSNVLINWENVYGAWLRVGSGAQVTDSIEGLERALLTGKESNSYIDIRTAR